MNKKFPCLLALLLLAMAPTPASSQETPSAKSGCLVRPTDVLFLDHDSTELEYFGSSRLASQMLSYFPRVIELDLCNVGDFDFSVFSVLRSLRCVRIRNITKIPRELFRALSCLSLSALHISGTELNSRDFSLLSGSDTIREIHVADSTIDNQCIKCIGQLPLIESVALASVSAEQGLQLDPLATCAKLSTLAIQGGNWLTDLNLRPLAHLASLKYLSISARRLSDLSLLYISQCTKLAALECRASGFSADGLKLLAKLRSLATLSLSSDSLDDRVLDSLCALDLRELELTSSSHVRPSIISNITTFYPKLEALRVRFGNQSSLSWDSIERCRRLRVLSISGCSLSETAFQSVTSLSRLEQLNLSGASTNSQSLCLLKHLSHLRSLSLSNIDSVDGTTIQVISGLATLHTLYLGGCRGLRSRDIRLLGQLAHLSVLSLGALDVAPEDLASLASCPLSCLEMRPKTLPESAVNVLLSMPRLHHLSFGDCDIATALIWKLAMKRTLRTLVVTQTQIGRPCPEYARIRDWRPELLLIVCTF